MRRLVDHGRSGERPVVLLSRVRGAGRLRASTTSRRERSPTRHLDDFLHRDVLRATHAPEDASDNAFRRYRLGQWVTLDGAWLPDGAWSACAPRLRAIEDGADIVLGFDGSFSGDCTALVAVTVADRPHVHLVRLWEAPEGARDWRVPIVEVEDAIRAACRRWRVLEVAADPYRWPAVPGSCWTPTGIPVGEYPQSPARMGPATSRLYSAVVDRPAVA